MIFKIVLNSAEKGALILARDPDGWKNMEAILKRSLEYHGIFYEFMAQFEFKCGAGKEYIDSGYDVYGIDWVCYVTISIACNSSTGAAISADYSDDYSDDYGSLIPGSNAPIFETLFEGTLKFDTYSKTDESTFCDLVQSDFVQKVINRFETKVNVDGTATLDNGSMSAISNTPFTLTVPSKTIRYISETAIDPSAQASPFTMTGPNNYFNHLPFKVTNSDIVSFTAPLEVIEDASGSFPFDPQELFIATLSGVYNITYNLIGTQKFENRSSNSQTLNNLFRYGVNQHAYLDASTPGGNVIVPSFGGGAVPANGSRTDTCNLSGTLSIYLNEGDTFWIGFLIYTTVPSAFSTPIITLDFTTVDINITLDSASSITYSDAYLVHELLTAVSQRITNQGDCFYSEMFGRKNSNPVSYDNNGCGSFLAFSTGKKLRNFPISRASLTISMSDLFKTLNSLFNVGLGIEQRPGQNILRMESKSYFYSTDVVIQLPFCPKIKTSIAKEYYITDVFIGYEKWESEETNGIDEFNTKHEYNTGIKAISSKVELLAPFIGSSYAIELTKRKPYFNFASLDFKYDNDTFIFCLKRILNGSGEPSHLNEVEIDENYSQINNIISPSTTYNYRISPARNLLRHIKSIAGSIIKYAGRPIKFTYGEGNYLASTQFTNDVCPGNFQNNLLSEKQDITVEASGESPIWIPEYLDFQYPLTFSQYLLIKANQFKCIEVSDSDENFIKGYIIELHYKPVGGLTTFKLLKAYAS